MSDGAAPRAVVVGHGAFAAAVIEVVGRISGKADQFRAVTNEGRDGPGIETAIREALADTGATVIFTDLPTGSCTIAARRIAHASPSLSVVTGASIPLLLAFAFGAGASPDDLERAAVRGRSAIEVFGGRPDRAG